MTLDPTTAVVVGGVVVLIALVGRLIKKRLKRSVDSREPPPLQERPAPDLVHEAIQGGATLITEVSAEERKKLEQASETPDGAAAHAHSKRGNW